MSLIAEPPTNTIMPPTYSTKPVLVNQLRCFQIGVSQLLGWYVRSLEKDGECSVRKNSAAISIAMAPIMTINDATTSMVALLYYVHWLIVYSQPIKHREEGTHDIDSDGRMADEIGDSNNNALESGDVCNVAEFRQ